MKKPKSHKPKSNKPEEKHEEHQPVARKDFDKFLGEVLRAKPLSKEEK